MQRSAVIVGAGVGGLTAAIGLHDAGWRVTVLERWPEVVGIGAALGMWPQAQDALATIGLGEQFAERSMPTRAAAAYRSDGRRLLALPAGRGPAVRLISRRTLMSLLLARADGIDIHTGVRAGADQLRALLTEHDVMLGADGLRSAVRSTFFDPATRPRYSGLVGWRGSVARDTPDFGETWGGDQDGRGMLFGLTPMEPGRTNFYAAFPAPEGGTDTLQDLRDRFSTWRDPIPAVLEATADDDALRNPIHDLAPPLPTFVAGRVAVLGDAAHAMTPHLGRGACEAVLDAVSLVRHLTGGDDVTAALQAYDGSRRRPAQRVAARSWRLRGIVHTGGTQAGMRNAAVRTAATLVGAR